MTQGTTTQPDPHPATWEAIDRLMALECRAINVGRLQALYDAARRHAPGPLCATAARTLVDAVKPRDPVVLITGAGGPPWLFAGETDGPLGLAGLARALAIGCGAWPLIITEARSEAPVAATLAAAGVSLLTEELARVRPTTATLVPFPTEPEEAARVADGFLDRYRPAALVVIEKNSPNRANVIHSFSGTAWTPRVEFARVEHLIAACRRRAIPTIGIGDHGNEMGFGLIEDTVRATVPGADVCRCPCGQGMAAAVATDIVIPASVSNWGGYGIEAALAILKRDPRLLHDAETERAMLRACVMAGAVDGLTSRQILAVDGTSAETQVAVLTLLAEIVGKALTPVTADY
ncbi:MAG TPA: glutamate cyclase domain-containing protein [Candidatus Sulfotelmatobacter sp.]|nr:glutamate cyclase domain-containing protein [Candidatus Sulfotelmatobacter sp.]